jgi:hypothetical protein
MKITKILGLALLTASAFTSANAMVDPTDARFNGKTPYQLKQLAADAINAAAGGPPPAYVATLTPASQLKTYIQAATGGNFDALFAEIKGEQIARINALLDAITPGGDGHDILDAGAAVGGPADATGIIKPATTHLGDFKASILATVNAAAFDIALSGAPVPVAGQMLRIKDMNLLNEGLATSIIARVNALVDQIVAGGAGVAFLDARSVADGAAFTMDPTDVKPGGLTKGDFKASLAAVLGNYQ